MKKIVLLFLCSITLNLAFAQKPTDKSNPNYDHDILYYYMKSSYQIIIPDSILDIVKIHAAKNGIHESVALKNSIFLKILFNPALSVEEKTDAANRGIIIYPEQLVIPHSIFRNMIAKWQSAAK